MCVLLIRIYKDIFVKKREKKEKKKKYICVIVMDFCLQVSKTDSRQLKQKGSYWIDVE